MGVYIPNMDMPEHCYECLLRQGNCCLLLYEAIPPTVPLTRLDDCPLIEIEEWTYSNGKMYVPKGTFQKILDDERRADDERL